MLSDVLAAPADPPRTWGNLIGLVAAALVFWAGSAAHQRWKQTRENPSPAGDQKAVEGVNPQVTAGSGPNDPSTAVAVRQATGLDEFVGQRVGRDRTSQIIRDARRTFRASESTVKRALRRARKGGAS